MSQSSSIVGVHYKVGKKIGEGSFGIIFEGINILNNQQVAIKFEPRKCEAPQLRDEYRSYRILNNTRGIPQAYFFGQEGVHSILIIDLLGPSLEDLFDWCHRKFSVKTVLQVAKQMIQRVEAIHERNLIYRDIKPDNFLIGRPDSAEANQIFVVDFGMAKQYRDPKTQNHIPYREKKALSGTARYMSINTHLGREQSRRDDLESLGHVFMYFLRGSLPWQGLKAPTNKQKYEKIGMKKQTTSVNELCYGLPIQFAQYLTYVRSLKFDEKPDYNYLVSLMDKAMLSLGIEDDGHYDWMDLNNGKGWDAALNKKANLHGYGNPHPPRKPHQVQQQQQLQQQQQQQYVPSSQHQQHQSSSQQPLLGRASDKNNSFSKYKKYGYQSISQQPDSRTSSNKQAYPYVPDAGYDRGNNTANGFIQNGGGGGGTGTGAGAGAGDDLHSDASSFNRKKSRTCFFCCW
ncbi:uncharacterized protein LODBEIA_P34980 [Lodderomyces beijingensis]|uniref:non-specific serine/threonine protein kinase n=1 Tax=Lodderomyces beijingensis TaxID=1775926 RepID=A0ABP0ZMY0_9ASCO